MSINNHIKLIMKGARVWNDWREKNPTVIPDLSNSKMRDYDFDNYNLENAVMYNSYLADSHFHSANLKGAQLNDSILANASFDLANLQNANLNNCDLINAHFGQAYLKGINLSGCDLQDAFFMDAIMPDANMSNSELSYASLDGANLRRADLSNSIFFHASITDANLSRANLSEADLSYARLVNTNLKGANISNCRIFGISAWDLNLKDAKQDNLIITPYGKSNNISIDNIEIAQFIYLLITNSKLRDVIDTVTSKVVLILGRFTPERKKVLDLIRNELRTKNYIPVLFDFEKPQNRDFIETVSIIAHMARFVIADITDPKIVLEELPHIVRNITIPIIPILLSSESREPVTLYNLRRSHKTLLDTYFYSDIKELKDKLDEKVIYPLELKLKEFEG